MADKIGPKYIKLQELIKSFKDEQITHISIFKSKSETNNTMALVFKYMLLNIVTDVEYCTVYR